MDFYKLKWKLKFRWKKFKGRLKLLKINYIINHNLMGEDEFYYRITRKNLQDLVKADPEQEYLEEHGLLPDEPEEEMEEPLPEPEPEEPGLLRKWDFYDLMTQAIAVGKTVYMVFSVKEFQDRTVLVMKIPSSDFGVEDIEETIEAPHEDGARYDAFSFDGECWRWDRKDGHLRFCPVVCETGETCPVRGLQGLALRVDKALAEERLSHECLEYAYSCTEEGYDWCMLDHAHHPVVEELDMITNQEDKWEHLRDMSFHCLSYWAARMQ